MSNGKDVVNIVAPIAGMVVMVACIVGFLVFTGKDLSVEQCLLIVGGVAAVFGFGVRAIRNGGSNGGAAASGAVLIVAAALLSGCAANPCLAERSTVAAIGIAVEMADQALPQDVENRAEVMGAARAAVDLGEAAVDGCETLRDDMGFRGWLGVSVGAIKAILELMRTFGVDLPDDVARMIEELDGELAPVSES